MYDSRAKKGSIIGSTANEAVEKNYRNSDVWFVENNTNPDFEKFNDKIISIAERVNSQVFNLELTSTMDPQYTIYSEGMHFDWHPDGPFGVLDARGLNCIPDTLHWRKLTCVTVLSDENGYQGGDFQIMSPSTSPDHCIHTIRLDAGSMILFPAYTAHRVTPVTSGVRKTLVHWFCGPRWR
jgi:PKHD-type hydroxylase